MLWFVYTQISAAISKEAFAISFADKCSPAYFFKERPAANA